jgi:hypothetical protein
MTTNDNVPGGGIVGIVAIAGREFHVKKLSTRAEYGLDAHLARRAKETMGPGGYFERAARVLDWLRDTKRVSEWRAMTEELTRLQCQLGAAPADTELYRQTPDGLACELWHRTRETHKEVTEADLRAVISDVNAPDVYYQLLEVLSGAGK